MAHMSPLPPIETRSLQVAKKCKIFRNGDKYYSGKNITLDNRKIRTFDAFLTGLTNDLKLRNGAVRKLVTPVNGHRIRDLDDIEDGKLYVAVGAEPFNKAVVYTQIESYSPRRNHRQNREERLIPAHHNKYLENVTGKISQVPIQGKTIDIFINGHFMEGAVKCCLMPYQVNSMHEAKKVIAEKVAGCSNYRCDEVFVNGQDIDKPTTVGLSSKQSESMTEAVKAVHEAIKEKHQYRVDQLCDLEGHILTDVKQIEANGLYVAKNFYHRFQPGRYEPHGRKNIIVPLSPRDKSQTKYLWKERSHYGGPGDFRRPRTLPPIQNKKHSPDHSVSSYPETRKRNQVNGVPIKPAKHTKRTQKQADYDKDDGGVFRAKNQNRDTRGAKEVRDTGDTKVDLPIDQVRAEEVKEEETFSGETEAKGQSGVQLSREPSDGSETQDERIKREKQGKDINSKSSKQADHSHGRPVQNGDRSHGKLNGEPSQSKGNVNNNQQSKTSQNGKNSTYKSNSKAPPVQSQTKSNVKNNDIKNDQRNQEPPKSSKTYHNHDAIRSSTPKENKKNAPPPKTTPSPTKDNKVPTPSEEHKAATKIQANYRGHQARKEVTDLKKKKEMNDKKRADDAKKAIQTREENEAATKIQAGFRGHQARKEIKDKKQVRGVRNSKEDIAATKIQSGFRGHKARKEVAEKKAKRTEQKSEEEIAATKIQAGFRGHQARKDINQTKQARNDQKMQEEKAATKIQAGFRGHQARKEVDNKKKVKAQNLEEEKAATKIQAGFRGHQARKEVQKKKNRHLDEKVDAITVIQAAARGFLVRRRIEKRENTKMLLRLRSAAQEEVMDILGLIHERDRAATTIQARYRGYKDRKEYKRVKVNEKKEESATFLQAQIRAFLARKDINKRLLMEMRKLDTPSNRQGYRDSLDNVQASFHGYLFRNVAFEKLHQILLRKDKITILQASARAYIERWHIRRRQVATLERYHKAASEMQVMFQGYLTRKKIAQNMARRDSSASKIQAGVRGYFARKGYSQQKKAVIRIQSEYRGYRARQQYENLARERRNSAAGVIQSNYRGYKVRKDIKVETRQLAITQLHASFRGFLDRNEVRIRLNHIEDIKLQKAATKIQTNYRGYVDRHKYQIMKRNRVNELCKINATTEIKAQFLGYITRRKLRMKQEAPSVDLQDNTPRFLEGSVIFDLQTTGNISTVRPRTGRLQASLSNVSCEQTYVINNNYTNTTDTADFKSMARSTSAHVDSFSLLQESFRSLLSKRTKSSKPPQQIFHEKTRLTAVSHVQACFRGFLTRRLISRMCHYDRDQSPINNHSGSPDLPSTTAPLLKNPNEIRLSGSYKHPEPEIQHRIMPFYDYNGEITTADETEIPEDFSYHRQYSNDEITSGNIDDDTNVNDEIPVQYILRRKSNLSIANSSTVRTSTPVDDDRPVQYLYRSRESTQHQTPGQTYRKSMIHNRYEEPSPIQSLEAKIPNPVMTDHSRFEEPSPLMQTSPVFVYTKRADEISPIRDTEYHDQKDVNSHRFEEPSPFPGNQNKIDVIQNRDKHTIQESENPNPNPNHSRFEEPSPLPSDTDKPDIEYPTSPRDTTHDLPTQTKSQQNPSSITLNSNDSELSIETFSRKLVNEIQSSALLKDEALLVLQAAFKGFLLRNLSQSRHLKKLSKMDVDDKTIFGDTAFPFLQAGFKGYLTQTRETTSPPEM